MNLFSLKRFSLLLLLTLTFLSFGCGKKVATPPPPPPAAPPPPAPPAPGVTLSADRTTITAGQSVTLTYTSTNAAAVSIAPGVGPVTPAATGTRQVTPTATTTYTATATGPGGSATSPGVGITVTAAAAPPPPPPAKVDPPPPADRRTLEQIFTQTMVPILFDYDKSSIRAGEETKLLPIAAWLKQTPAVRFTIEGHADERGSQEYNIALGDERAASVKKYLAGQGVAENRMNTVSYGEERPICRDQNEDCFQKNRRAAFVKIP